MPQFTNLTLVVMLHCLHRAYKRGVTERETSSISHNTLPYVYEGPGLLSSRVKPALFCVEFVSGRFRVRNW